MFRFLIGLILLAFSSVGCTESSGTQMEVKTESDQEIPNCLDSGFIDENGHLRDCMAPVEIEQLYQRAKDKDPTAYFELARLFEQGGSSELAAIEIDLEQSAAFLKLAAELGHTQSQARLAWMYNRYFLPMKADERDFWNCKAAQSGNGQAIVNLKNQLLVSNPDMNWEDFCDRVLEHTNE